MKVTIETIPHDQHRYPTSGDWYYQGEGPERTLVIRVSKLSDWRFEALIAVHELAEVLLCQHRGIEQAVVDHFDMEFEEKRESQLLDGTIPLEKRALIEIEEPGDQPGAPYRAEHCLATGIERILAAALGVVWADYEKELESLP